MFRFPNTGQYDAMDAAIAELERLQEAAWAVANAKTLTELLEKVEELKALLQNKRE